MQSFEIKICDQELIIVYIQYMAEYQFPIKVLIAAIQLKIPSFCILGGRLCQNINVTKTNHFSPLRRFHKYFANLYSMLNHLLWVELIVH